MEQRSTSYHSQGLARALRVLRELGSSPEPLTLTALARRLELPKSTLIRLLSVLETEGFVRRIGSPPTFDIGDTMIGIVDAVVRRDDAATLAAPVLRRLADDTGLTANIGVLAGESVLHLRVEEPERPLRFRSAHGSLDYLHCTGLGKMLLARIPPQLRASRLPREPFPSFTDHTITTISDLDAELAMIARRGHSVDLEERDIGVVCLAAPVPNDLGAVVAVSVAGPAAELSPSHQERLLPRLTDAAEHLGAHSRFLVALRSVRDAYPTEGTP